MASASQKTEITVAFYRRVPAEKSSWHDRSDWSDVDQLLQELTSEFYRLNISLLVCHEEQEMVINGYTDVLNSIRLRLPDKGFGNTCLGHVIGVSPDCNVIEDLKRGINRLLFAPETIEPQGSDKVVCHNCGCGC